MSWFKKPDQVGGWKTNNDPTMKPGDFLPIDVNPVDFLTEIDVSGFGENQSNNMLQLRSVFPPNIGFFTHPLDYQINDPSPQYYPIGLMPLGLDISARALIGINPFGRLQAAMPAPLPLPGGFVLGESKLGGTDVLG